MKTIKFLIAILFAAGLTNSPAQNTWTRKADFGGTARYGAVGFSIGSKGYIGTGMDGSNRNDFWEYDPATNAWTQKANFGGSPRRFATGFSIGNKGYIGTGQEDGYINKNDLWEYDPATNAWKQKANFGGEARLFAVGFSIGSKGYISTGSNFDCCGGGDLYKDFWEYDPGTDKWTQKADFGGAARWVAVGLSIGNKGYIGTGSNIDQSVYYRDFWEYDPGTDTWTKKTDYPGAYPTGGTGFSIEGKGYVGTGQDHGAGANDFWEYDPGINKWTQKANFGGSARWHAIGFSIGTKGYIGTGAPFYTKDFWEYTPGNSCPEPTGLKVVRVSDTCAVLRWNTIGSDVVKLQARYRPSGAATWTRRTIDAAKKILLINKLVPNTTYNWQLRSLCTEDTSGWVSGPDFITVPLQLIAWYPFNGNAQDESGNGYNGTISGATLSDDRFGNPKSAYSFDGVNDEIVIGKEPNFPSWDTYAVSLWFLNNGKGDQSNGYGQKILSKAQFYTDFHLSVQGDPSNGRLTWWSAQGGFNAVDASSKDYRDNKWHHVILNKHSPSNGDIWVDGVLKNSSNDLQAVFNNEDLVIGFTTHSDGYQRKYFSGKIDDIRIYNSVLSKSKILELFTEGGCNGLTVYADADGDHYGNAANSLFVTDCVAPAGYVLDSTDCNDKNAAIYPGAKEIIGDGIDNNCNGLVDEKLNNSLSCDGADDYVQTPISSGTTFTLEAWIKPDITGADVGIIGNDDNAYNGKNWMLSSNGKMYIHNAHPYVVTDIYSTRKVPFGEWSHVAASVNAGTVTFYINGIVSGSGSPVEQYGLSWGIGMGWRNPLGGAFKGQIDEVRIWNAARTQEEIKADMQGGSCGDQNGLIAYYSFNQGIAGGNNTGITNLVDITSNHNDGTLNGFALTGAKSNWVTGVPGLSDSVLVFKDADNDNYGNAAISKKVSVCAIPTGYVINSTDCNDADASIHPNATEKCNGIDDNCNAVTDEIAGLFTTNIKAKTATFNWKLMPGARRYIVKYKRIDPAVTEWSTTGAANHVISITVAGLVPNSKYVWKIRTDCGDFNTALSGPVRFTTAATLTAGQQNDALVAAVVKELSVYPNPTSGSVTVNLTLTRQQSVSIRVFDLIGKEVYASNEGMRSGTFTKKLALGRHNPGVYFLKVIHNGETEMRKIVISK